MAIRLISLLRTQLKSDLAIYGATYSGQLNEYESLFLERSDVDLPSRFGQERPDSTHGGIDGSGDGGSGESGDGEIAADKAANVTDTSACRNRAHWQEWHLRHRRKPLIPTVQAHQPQSQPLHGGRSPIVDSHPAPREIVSKVLDEV